MQVSYKKLWKLLIDKGINKTQLKDAAGVSSSTISKMGKNEQISMDSMLKICKALGCNIGDIVEIENVERLQAEQEIDM